MKHLSIIFTILVIILSTILLIGKQIGYKWAGGDGIITPVMVYNESDQEYQRGEVISSGKEFTKLYLGNDIEIWLDIATEISLIDLNPQKVTINLLQGRIVTKGQINISVRDAIITSNNEISLIHYSWENSMQMIPIDGEIILIIPEQEKTINEVSNFSTLPPYDITPAEFNPNVDSVKEFYEWTGVSF